MKPNQSHKITYPLHPANAGINLSRNCSNSSLLYCNASRQGVHRLLGQVEGPSPIDSSDIDCVICGFTRVGKLPAGTAGWRVPGESRHAPYEWEGREVPQCLESLGLKPVVSVGACCHGERGVGVVVDGAVGDIHRPVQCKSMEGKGGEGDKDSGGFHSCAEEASVDVVMKGVRFWRIGLVFTNALYPTECTAKIIGVERSSDANCGFQSRCDHLR